MHFLLALVFVFSAHAETMHQPSEEEVVTGNSTPTYNDSVITPVQSKKTGNEADPKEDQPVVKSKTAKPPANESHGGYPLIIFAQDPLPTSDREHSEVTSLVNEMREFAKKKAIGAKIIEVTPFTVDKVEKAVLGNSNLTHVESALLIVNTRMKHTSRGGLIFQTQAGEIPQTKWEMAFAKLSRSIFPLGSGRKLNTVLLVASAGSADCAKMPGPLFGMSPAGLGRDLASLRLWVKLQKERHELPFPQTAKEWFESWGITNKLSRRRYFYCPVANVKGYLGYKNSSDPINDNAGVDWDINDR